MFSRYADRVNFLAVYVREAHPTDGWRLPSNDALGIAVQQPKSDAERSSVAQHCGGLMEMSIPMVVDSLDDRVGHAFSAMPDRLYVIDPEGTIAYKSGRGPFGFQPGEMEQSLTMVLMESRAPTPEDDPLAEFLEE